MITIDRLREGVDHLIHRQILPINSVPRGQTRPPLEVDQPNLADPKDIDWMKFKHFYSVLPVSVENFDETKMRYGDIYETERFSGKPLILLPIHFAEWKTKRGSCDFLLVLGFNSQQEVVGIRTVTVDLSYGDVLRSRGAVASAICNEGIASALEEVRERSAQELLMHYQTQGHHFKLLEHTIEDENITILRKLRELSLIKPADPSLQERLEHAEKDRPRWVTLFDPEKSGREQKGNHLHIYPQKELVRGFNAAEQVVYKMTRLPMEEGRSNWAFEDLGSEARERHINSGLFDKSVLTRSMRKALEKRPE